MVQRFRGLGHSRKEISFTTRRQLPLDLSAGYALQQERPAHGKRSGQYPLNSSQNRAPVKSRSLSYLYRITDDKKPHTRLDY